MGENKKEIYMAKISGFENEQVLEWLETKTVKEKKCVSLSTLLSQLI